MNRRNFFTQCLQTIFAALGIGVLTQHKKPTKPYKKLTKPYKHTVLNVSHPLAKGLVLYELFVDGKRVESLGFNRCLSDEEVNTLIRDPFCMFDGKTEKIYTLWTI